MFAILSCPITRCTINHAVRCMASKPPPPPVPKLSEEPMSSPATSTSTSTPPSMLSLDFSPPEPKEETQRTGARSSKDSLSTMERKRQFLGRASLAFLVLGLGINVVYMGREWSEEELEAKKMSIADAPSTRWARTKDRFAELFDYFNKPVWPELLPPPLPAPHQKPYTLLISIDDLLVTSTWDRQHGWRTAKRPGVDYFLAYISQFYEVVIFTTQYHYTAIPILEKLDRFNFFINYRLFREATRSINGKIVKDLSYLNRDLSKVISLDTNEEHVSTHPENSIIIPEWKGDPRDRGLIAMIPFLESIGIYKPPDVRPILAAYRGKDIPIEYAKKEAESKQKHIEEWKNSKGISAGGFTLSGLFGGNSGFGSGSSSPVPPTYLEHKRKEAQLQYKEEQAYLEAHKADFEKLLQQDQQAMAKETPSNLLEAINSWQNPKGGPQKEQDNETPSPTTGGTTLSS